MTVRHTHQCEHACQCRLALAVRCVDCELQHVYAERFGPEIASERHVLAVPVPMAEAVIEVADTMIDYEDRL